MTKNIAVLVRERQNEALRMAVGLILLDDRVDVFVLDRAVAKTDDNDLNLETMRDLDMKLYSTVPDNRDMEVLSAEHLAERLLGYDHIIPY